MPQASRQQIADFLETLWDFYARSGRHDLPWRQAGPDGVLDPYKVMVSELMLQQTQVPRVIPKYHEFLERFPTVHDLAAAELGDVLRTWQGLGYNRRAKFLWQAAQAIDVQGRFPDTLEGLVALPGIGPNTAGAILAYAYGRPVVFIETNVRTVYLYHFFPGETDVTDKAITELLTQTLFGEEGKEQPDKMSHLFAGARRKTAGLSPVEQPRDFYWALMDYGSHLKATVGNPNRASKHYAKQSAFHGSRRQVRGQVIRLLGIQAMPWDELRVAVADDRLEGVLHDLVAEGMVHEHSGIYFL